jgi:hypothetical protein
MILSTYSLRRPYSTESIHVVAGLSMTMHRMLIGSWAILFKTNFIQDKTSFKTNFIQDKLHSRQTYQDKLHSREQMRDVGVQRPRSWWARILLYLVIKEVALLTCFPSSECWDETFPLLYSIKVMSSWSDLYLRDTRVYPLLFSCFWHTV